MFLKSMREDLTRILEFHESTRLAEPSRSIPLRSSTSAQNTRRPRAKPPIPRTSLFHHRIQHREKRRRTDHSQQGNTHHPQKQGKGERMCAGRLLWQPRQSSLHLPRISSSFFAHFSVAIGGGRRSPFHHLTSEERIFPLLTTRIGR